MKISFHIGSSSTNQENTILISQIKSKSKLDVLTSITKKSNSLFKTEEHPYLSDEGKDAAVFYNLTIFLPEKGEDTTLYGSFEYLFEQDSYNQWKQLVLDKFPDLADQFSSSEKEARAQQELNRRYKELEILSGRNRFPSKASTKLIEERIDELKRQLYPESPRRGPFIKS